MRRSIPVDRWLRGRDTPARIRIASQSARGRLFVMSSGLRVVWQMPRRWYSAPSGPDDVAADWYGAFAVPPAAGVVDSRTLRSPPVFDSARANDVVSAFEFTFRVAADRFPVPNSAPAVRKFAPSCIGSSCA